VEALVASATQTIKQDWHRVAFQRLLKGRLHKYFPKDEEAVGFQQAMARSLCTEHRDDMVEEECGESDLHILNDWVNELLKFLALKALYLEEEKADGKPVDFDDDDLSVSKRRKVLVPSEPVREAWRCLLLLPVTYYDVCISLGCQKVIDYDEFTTTEKDDPKTRNKNYTRTMEKYKEIYKLQPPKNFWPRVTYEWELDPLEEIIKTVVDLGNEIMGMEEDVEDYSFNCRGNGFFSTGERTMKVKIQPSTEEVVEPEEE